MKVLVGVLTSILVVLYPLGVWFGLSHFSAREVSLWILALVVPSLIYRLRGAKREDVWAVLRIPLVVIAVVSLGAALDDQRFVLAMPVLINIGLLITFQASLRGVPMIERVARIHAKEELDEARVAHCRQATWLWIGFFAFNATVAAVLGWNPAYTEAWATYNGGIAYALMGLVFASEFTVRRYRFRLYGDGLYDRLLRRIFPPREGES